MITSMSSAMPLVAPPVVIPWGVCSRLGSSRGPAIDEFSGESRTEPAGTATACASVVRLLGVPSVVRGDRRIVVPEGSKRLIAFVALRPVRVERAYAAGTLWPDGDDLRAVGNLRSALWRLRRIGIEVVDADKWSLALSTGVVVDVHEVARWAGRLISGTESVADLSLRHVPDDAWCLLPGTHDVWVVMERERLRQLLLHALEALAWRLMELGRHSEAVDVALRAVGHEPLRESAQRALLSAYLAAGDVVEAKRAYRRFEHAVRTELGVEPSRVIRQLLGTEAPTGVSGAAVRRR